jgi:hypothetical protein
MFWTKEETKNVPKCFDPPKRGAKVRISGVSTIYFLFNGLILPYLQSLCEMA